jgi:hypothetical protein
MNRFEKEPLIPGLAKVSYGDGEVRVITPGAFVLCAVTGARIPLEELRYWSVARQEAYANATVATERAEALKPRGRS